MRHRLTFEKPVPAADGAGGSTITWNEVAEVWGEITPLRPAERQVGEGIVDTTSHKITIRFRSNVAAGDRFLLGQRVFAIKGVTDPGEDQRYLVCLADEEASA